MELARSMAELSESKMNILWESNELLSSQYTTPVVHEGMLFGIHGRQDAGEASLVCLDPAKQGKSFGRKRDLDMQPLIKVNKTLLVMKTDGELVLVKCQTDAYQELARAQLVSGENASTSCTFAGKNF